MWTRSVIVSLLVVSCTAYGGRNDEHHRSAVEIALAQKGNPQSTVNEQWNRFQQRPGGAAAAARQQQQQHRLMAQDTSSSLSLSNKQHGSIRAADRWAQDVETPVVHKRLMSLAQRICWSEATPCQVNTTCVNCCEGKFYETSDGMGVCGEGCLADGTVCMDEDKFEWNCWNCCNGAFADGGKTCGGQCTAAGTLCDIDTTCMTCCNYTYYQVENDKFQCGCKEDGASCNPDRDCYSCCNGAYNNGGLACGGTCIPDENECIYGETCHLCCMGYSFWYSTGKFQCGYEDCYEDGTKCIPGETCSMCCNGAFADDGTTCGGECLPLESKCSYFGSCNKCCPDMGYPWGFPPPSNSTTEVSSFPTVTPWPSMSPFPFYYGSPSSHWNATQESMVCGNTPCLEDGTSCTPGMTCYQCCTGAYADGGTKCGGTCLEDGTTCDYYSTCNSCCSYRYFNATLGSFVCGFEEYRGVP